MYGLRLDVLRISNNSSDAVSATELSKHYEKWIEKRLVWLEREAETRDSIAIKMPGGIVEIRGRFEDADEKTDDFVNMDGDADAIEKFREKIIDLIVSKFKFYSLHIVIRPQVKKNEDGIETLKYLDFARVVEHMPAEVKAVSIEGYRSEHRDDVRVMLAKCPLESLKIHGEKGALIPKAFFYQLKTDNLKELIIDCQTDVDKAVLERLDVPTLKIRSQNLVDTDISEYLKKWVATRNDDHSLEIAFRRRRNKSKTDQFKIVHKCKSACPSCCNHLKHRMRDVEEVLRPLHLDEVKYPGEKPYLVAEVLAAHWAEPHGLTLKPPL